ncbi:hypothetical protein AN5119.2 [Aspergillus nidulans FGSC A4]|uniref:tRNA methyltransferase (Eurofung) n=1 Tax=Emericella nidulans (strain FGSC A4 / ATCC 38163 / CBS 112.46 / NRRL 194 / M139) TaxID=227321 RepID=Q5B2W1_EMENI|nr:tRNA (carboxymethyluridine(34)-5-O)-methyltransferase [Aspergillus nidulans FGSC A4]EAA62300.1 hypothetical protein AN5119.2 [Aspergillus nidulans FGSC A4]CBF80896.1 TPA: tRNA methyltransferase (Eurofung) [Aspergillus nidulans FGSC A4]|eukprot:XP_662723.1 hypothetical protein AN5119.2 [Aspergillus nidulans FGSC A4]
MTSIDRDEAYEEKNVHEVYQQIAKHFSATRYKVQPWPIVERFLQDQKPGAVGLDVGCGNGKYLPVNKSVYILASDRSENLAQVARQHEPHSTILADILNLPHPDSFFDFAISIAVVHHLSTPERRVQAIREILRTLKPASGDTPGGRALVYVWALEQKNSRRGWDKGDDQDIMVPWVLKTPNSDNTSDTQPKAEELERDVESAGGRVLESGYDRDNWWAIATRVDQKN